VDGDGDLDVLSASFFDDKIAWYENNGSQNFLEHTISTAADGAASVFVADVDGDGDLDVLSTSFYDFKIAWYENLGNEPGSTPALSIGDVALAEGDSGETDFTFTISIDVASASDVNVDYATADDSAAAASDYTAISGTATITAGATSTTVTVKVQGDTAVESNETFFVNLSNPVNATIADNLGLGTITNDDSATLTISNVTETKTDSDFTVQATVMLSADVEGGFDAAYSSALGTADATDITVQGTSLSFLGTAGETQTIDVVIIGDDLVEDDETFTITLGDVTGTSAVQDAAITTGAVSYGLIIDDDVAVPTIDLDVDANGEAGALTDGVLIVRSLFGVTGTQLTDGALGTGAVRTDSAEIIAFLDLGLTTMLDVDANGEATALTDGVLIVRYLFGVTGTQLTDGALGTGALRTDSAEIIAFLDGFLPAAASASLVASTQDVLISHYDEPTVSVGIPGNVETGPNFAQGTFNDDASTTNVVRTTGDVVLPPIDSGPLLYPVPSEEEPDDESLMEEAPVIVPEEQAELDILFGDLGGSLQDELLAE
jgi:hypothetical protein